MSKITVNSVRKQFSSKLAVDDVSFDVPGGQVFGLLGPNGAGKTTLIRMLMDIIRPDSGSILYDGQPLSIAYKDRITYLPEERGLYRKQKVKDVLEYFARLKGLSGQDARRQIALYLGKLEMSDKSGVKIEELSKGNQQKVQIAAALLSNPEIVILDEPFSGLDPLNVRITKALVADEKRSGKTILLSTHQMNQVEELCDNLLMLHNGRRVLYGSVAAVLEQYAEAALLLQCDPLQGEFPQIEQIVPQGRYQKVFPRAGYSNDDVLRCLLDRGTRIESFQRATTPLEEIFVRVVSAADISERAAS